METSTIKVSEVFYSLQGEGITVGTPAVFLRLSMCSLACTFCDTFDVWTKGEDYQFDELDAVFDLNGYYSFLKRGAHLVVTGGDPLIQQDAVVKFLERAKEYGRDVMRMFIEVETQGTVKPKPELIRWVRQWNISPKLSNSGMPDYKRLNYDALRFYASMPTACFKFPVSTIDDLKEAEVIISTAGIRRCRVYLMPVCSTREGFQTLGLKVAEMCKKSGYRLGMRLHLTLWDKTCGV